jgi:O-methyltransferase
MVRTLNSAINRSLSPLGVELRRRGYVPPLLAQSLAQYRGKLHEAVEEMERLIRTTVFPDLPSRNGRHDLMTQLLGTQLSEAFHLLVHLNRTVALEGNVCEFGVAQGTTSALIANEIRETDKVLWLFDSFEGLPKPTDRDVLIDDIFNLGSIEKYEGTMACGIEQVTSRLNSIDFPLSRTKIVAGFIEESSKRANLPEKVCFAYVDFDFYQPIRIALELLDAKLPVGGVVIVDDYGFFSDGAKAAVDEFAAERKHRYTKEPSPSWAGHFCILRRCN